MHVSARRAVSGTGIRRSRCPTALKSRTQAQMLTMDFTAEETDPVMASESRGGVCVGSGAAAPPPEWRSMRSAIPISSSAAAPEAYNRTPESSRS